MAAPSTPRKELEMEIRQLSKQQDEAIQGAIFLGGWEPRAYAAYGQRRVRLELLREQLASLDAA
jgi:hypothetical protein